ncbi:MAG: MFS transporter [Prevotella sp.]|nr:MFS transporter [Prevotella sp.]
MIQHSKTPWAWVPTLYIAEGLPNVIVTSVAVVLYMQLGLSDAEIGLYTGWLGLPWIIKPLWSPFVDLYKTKRWWVLLTQMLLGSSLAGIAFTLETDFWLQGTLCCFFLMAFSSATHDIAADGYYMLELSEHQQAWFVGIRNTFYRLAVIFGNGVLVPVAGLLQEIYPGRAAFTWSLVFFGTAGLFLALWLWHSYMMPHAEADKRRETSAADIARGLKEMLVAFVRKMPWKPMLAAILFILFYRFPEALLNAMSKTFLTRPQEDGGLGLSLAQYGLSYGTVGLIGLLLGGIVGGMLASRDGLKRWLWPMVCAITLPDAVYVWMSLTMPTNMWLISTAIFIEQFGYGLGFTALTLYMLYFSMGEFKTSHYAICTGISYLGLQVPAMFSGYLKDAVGYSTFFIIVMAMCSVTFLVAAFVQIDPQFGKKDRRTLKT